MLILCITVNDIEIQNRFEELLCKTKHEHYFLTIKSLTVRNILFPIILYQSNIGVFYVVFGIKIIYIFHLKMEFLDNLIEMTLKNLSQLQ